MPPRSLYRETSAPFALTAELSLADRRALAGIATRRALRASSLYAEKRELLEAATFAMEYGRPNGHTAPAPSSFLRVASWNIQRGNALDGIKAFIDATPLLRDADVLLLNEVDIGMARSGNRNVASEIAELLGCEYVFGNSYVCLDHGDAHDGVQAEENALGLHGNAILSRHPIVRAENISIHVTRDKFQSRSEKRLGHKKALWAELATPLGVLPVACVHLDPIGSTAQRAAHLGDVMATLEHRGVERLLLGGDLNTTTYDLKSLPRLAKNILSKMVRGGFPHAIHHYMHPWEIYERPVFEVLRAAGLEHLPFNDMSAGTTRYEVGSYDSESKVRDHLPELAVKLLRHKLKPWNGVAPLHIDWFAARGLRALSAGSQGVGVDRLSVDPTPVAQPRHQGELLSDHDPIVVDVVFDEVPR